MFKKKKIHPKMKFLLSYTHTKEDQSSLIPVRSSPAVICYFSTFSNKNMVITFFCLFVF